MSTIEFAAAGLIGAALTAFGRAIKLKFSLVGFSHDRYKPLIKLLRDKPEKVISPLEWQVAYRKARLIPLGS